MIDTQALKDYLEATLVTLAEAEAKYTDGENAEVAARFAGGKIILTKVIERLPTFEIQPKQTSAPWDTKGSNKTSVRKHGLDTSFDAANANSGTRKDLYGIIYSTLLQHGPMTDDELRNLFDGQDFFYGHSDSVSKRRGELRDAGWVEQTSLRRPSNVGHNMVVWAAVAAQGA